MKYVLEFEEDELPIQCIGCGEHATEVQVIRQENTTVGVVFVCEGCKPELVKASYVMGMAKE
jgi:predicted SprT family Zn-dependent metalloprotease